MDCNPAFNGMGQSESRDVCVSNVQKWERGNEAGMEEGL